MSPVIISVVTLVLVLINATKSASITPIVLVTLAKRTQPVFKTLTLGLIVSRTLVL